MPKQLHPLSNVGDVVASSLRLCHRVDAETAHLEANGWELCPPSSGCSLCYPLVEGRLPS